jgi:hypothetical protein
MENRNNYRHRKISTALGIASLALALAGVAFEVKDYLSRPKEQSPSYIGRSPPTLNENVNEPDRSNDTLLQLLIN